MLKTDMLTNGTLIDCGKWREEAPTSKDQLRVITVLWLLKEEKIVSVHSIYPAQTFYGIEKS